MDRPILVSQEYCPAWLQRLSVLLLLGTLTALAGCQQPNSLDRSMPLPSLSGPVITPPPAQAVPVPAQARQTQPVPRVTSNAPAGWVPSARANAWRYIVIHHSATPRGGAKAFDQSHRQRGWDGLGYHFVIGNGTDTRDGQIEVGPRWPTQKHGAHAGVKLYNEYGIGICLVGDFNIDRPSAAQISSLTRLVAYLMQTYHVPAARVLGHRDCKATDCPGRFVNVAEIRRLASQRVASGLANR